jgi:hypothetical protein
VNREAMGRIVGWHSTSMALPHLPMLIHDNPKSQCHVFFLRKTPARGGEP